VLRTRRSGGAARPRGRLQLSAEELGRRGRAHGRGSLRRALGAPPLPNGADRAPASILPLAEFNGNFARARVHWKLLRCLVLRVLRGPDYRDNGRARTRTTAASRPALPRLRLGTSDSGGSDTSCRRWPDGRKRDIRRRARPTTAVRQRAIARSTERCCTLSHGCCSTKASPCAWRDIGHLHRRPAHAVLGFRFRRDRERTMGAGT
jgi:hypothetical protein